MKEKVILAIIIVCLSIFGFRSILPEIPLSALIALFTIAGIIGCYYHLWNSRNKRRKN